MRKKLGLALGAGGSRGVAHVGFLKALEEAGIRADCVTGCSMGAIVGACYCAGVSPDGMRERLVGIKLQNIASFNVSAIKAGGLFRLAKARKILADTMGEKEFGELKIPFACVATNLETGHTDVLREGSVVDAAIASSSIPGAFTPAEFNGNLYVDGGILERVPTKPLHGMGAEVVVAVDVLGDLLVKKMNGNLIDTVLRCIDIVDTRNTMRKKHTRKSVDLWLEADLGDMDQYKVRGLGFAYDKGYELGKANAEAIARLIGA